MIKYEIDKVSGYLRVDRPQRTSSHPPALYGFIPTHLLRPAHRETGARLSERVTAIRSTSAWSASGRSSATKCMLRARVIGGLKLLDRGEADDKIIAVLEGDYIWDTCKDISQLPPVLVERLEHYFSTYKMVPGEPNKMQISGKYGFDHAKAVIEAARADYQENFGEASEDRRRN